MARQVDYQKMEEALDRLQKAGRVNKTDAGTILRKSPWQVGQLLEKGELLHIVMNGRKVILQSELVRYQREGAYKGD